MIFPQFVIDYDRSSASRSQSCTQVTRKKRMLMDVAPVPCFVSDSDNVVRVGIEDGKCSAWAESR